MSVLVVVPARYGSTRFPAKVLAALDGKPIVRWCHDAAKAAQVGETLVATEDARVAEVVRGFGGQAVMTSPDCQSGTDRCREAAKGRRADYVINVQGDQPFIAPETIRSVAKLLQEDRMVDIATAVVPLTDEERLHSPHVVKAVRTRQGRCLYFSRSPIPYPRNPASAQAWEHIGIYGFRREALERFVALPASPLEMTESLEQLRALEAGMVISSTIVDETPIAIDTPEDLVRAETFLRRVK